jgi:hypothetical protein
MIAVIGVSCFWEEHITSVQILSMLNLLNLTSEFCAIAMFVVVDLWTVW